MASSKQYAELRWGMTSWSGAAIDVLKSAVPQVYNVEALVAQNLVEAEPDGAPKPGLASSFEQPNSTTYVYNLRSGVRFSDGQPVTASDVVYSLERNVTGKEAWTHAYWEDVASVAARGSSAVVIKLKRPDAVWQHIMCFTSPITEKSQLARTGEKALGTPGDLPIGSGPWKLDEYTEATVQLSPNPYWRGAKLPARQIKIALFKDEASLALALRSGAIDGTFDYSSPKMFSNLPGVRQIATPGNTVLDVGMNVTQPPFNDIHVRRAIAYATDIKGIVKALYPGDAATENESTVPASLFVGLGTADQVSKMLSGLPKYGFNLAAAKEELAKSAYPHGFSTTLYAPSAEASVLSAAQILASDLAKIGITVKIHEMSSAEEETIQRSPKVTMVVTTLYSVYPDPEGVMSSLFAPSAIPVGINFARYDNSEVNRLQAEQRETLSPSRRLQLIGQLLHIAGSDVPYVPTYSPDTLAAVSEKYVFPTFSSWTALFRPWALDVKLAS
ncbi:MAG TPA: ABC transporter substrate-binding protein [Solirubrobacteraceae bacterium]|jgi:peptide/nickel transport system substrate-binding protein|nr:ABC transporter substrate-binding protein [Solirubrobacteraceae bacterium]